MNSKKRYDEILRLNVESVANEPGDWISPPENDLLILQNAIFQSLFSYFSICAEDSKLDLQYEIGPERIINAMLKRTEIEIVDALIKSYNKRIYGDSAE
tara:strand:- start:9814 stop:10110 length:297 start_codon:yes stop_codon:yes gene_type:complete